MWKNRKTFSALLIFLAVLSLVVLQPNSLGLAQSQTSSPTPNSVFTPLEVIVPEFQAHPLPLKPSSLVNITFSLHSTPNSECHGIPLKPLDAFIVIDNTADTTSETVKSLEGLKESVLEFIIQADQDVYNNEQATPSSFSIVPIQNSSTPTSLSLSTSAEARTLVNSLSTSFDAEGDLSTTIDNIRNVYQSMPQVGNQPVIALFLHSRKLITEQALNAISFAKEAGFDIILVTHTDGVSSQAISKEDGMDIASRSLFFQNPTSLDIRKAFVDLAQGNFDWLARNISVKAVIFPVDALETIQVDSGSTVLDGVINWNEPFITNGQTLFLAYQARVNPDLNTNDVYINLDLSYIDCNGLPQHTARSFPLSAFENMTPSSVMGTDLNGQNTSPDISNNDNEGGIPPSQQIPPVTGIDWAAFLPFLKWLGVALLIGLLLFLLWKFLMREKTSLIKKPEEIKPPVKIIVDPIPVWFKELKDNNTDGSFNQKDSNIELQETILIGLGPVGRNVLTKIIARLNANFGDAWRSKIRVIQVDMDLRRAPQPRDWQIPSGLRREEWILLQPELAEIQERIQKNPKDWEHLRWYEKTAPTYSRSQSRMALFFDLRDGPPSQFWHAIESAYYELDKPLVRVIGSTFDAVSSGILADVAFLVKQGITHRNADVELWLLGPSQEEWVEAPNTGKLSPSEQTVRTLATLRELERFQRNTRVAFQYVPHSSQYTQLNQVYNYAVTPTVFFFDPLSKNLKHGDMLREMSNTLASLLYEKTAQVLSKYLKDTRIRAAGRSVVCGIGHFELRLSSGLLEEAVARRMVKDVLFEELMGFFPMEQLQPNGDYQVLPGFVPSSSFDVLNEQDSIKKWIKYSVKTGDRQQLYNNIAARLGQILNGEPATTSHAIQGRRMALDKAERWLKLLVGTVKMYPDLQVMQKINRMQDQLSMLRSWLTDEVAPMAQSRWNGARANLQSLRGGGGLETDIPKDLDWPAYKEYILLNDSQRTRYTDQSPLLKISSRFGWHVNFDENENEWKINLIMPPSNFSWQEGYRPEPYAIQMSASTFLDSLYKIALPFAQMGMGRSAVERANTMDISDWKDRVDPTLRYDDLEASRLLGSLTHSYILGMSEEISPRESRELIGKLNTMVKPIDVVNIKDRSVVHFLHVVTWIPFETTDIYRRDQWVMSAPPPSYYVWSLEQWASSIETDPSNRLSVAFLTRYNEYEKFMTAFGRGLIYDLFALEIEGGWTVPFAGNNWKRMMPQRNPNLAASLLDMFFTEHEYETQRDSFISVWNSLIEERRAAVKGAAYEFFRNFEQTRLKAYFHESSEDSGAEKDLGVFLTYLLQMEKQALRAR